MTSAPKRLLGADLGRPSRRPKNPWEGLLISDLRRETTVFSERRRTNKLAWVSVRNAEDAGLGWCPHIDGAKPQFSARLWFGRCARRSSTAELDARLALSAKEYPS